MARRQKKVFNYYGELLRAGVRSPDQLVFALQDYVNKLAQEEPLYTSSGDVENSNDDSRSVDNLFNEYSD